MATAYGPETRDHHRTGAAPGDHPRAPRTKHFFPAALRAPLEARTWRELGYLLLSLPISVVLFSCAVVMTSLGLGMLITFLGIPVLAAGLVMCRRFGALERGRARGLLKLDVPDPEPLRGRTGGLMSWVGAVLRSGASWRHLLYALLHFPWAVLAFTVALTFWSYGWATFTYPLWHWVFPAYAGTGGIQLYGDRTHEVYLDTPFELAVTSGAGLAIVLVTPWIIRGLASVDRLMVAGLLGPSRLATRVSELESDRGVVVDTAAADLRRIERDLHDGAQARL
ncbi:sensor domain-containing protein, partial [Streptomyces sp. NPDC057429]|uniref:sensor histidine kinase n=1 Tax=Streptomyces sp. NPDC057429 TaxID=3346130 RepID=UPI0036A77133